MAQKLGRLFVPFDEKGHPIEERVGRHIAGITEFATAFSREYPDRPLGIGGLPGFEELAEKGLGAFLLEPPK